MDVHGEARRRLLSVAVVAWIVAATGAPCPAHAGATTPLTPIPATQPGSPHGDPGRATEPHPAPPGPPGPPSPPQPPRLFPRLALARAAGWMLDRAPAPASRDERAEQNLERWFDDQLDHDRMSAVGAAPYYHDMMRSMRRAFRPDMGALRAERRANMSPLGIVWDELSRYARGPEKPQDAPGTVPTELQSQFDAEEQHDLEVMDQMSLLNAPVTWYRVDLRVTQNPEGVVSAVWLLHSSGYHTLDDAALAAVRDGAVRLPPPPAALSRGRDAIESDWAFEAGDVATYWNTGGCVDDPVHGGMQCAGLGRGLVRTRIRLLRVVDAAHPTSDERRGRVPERRRPAVPARPRTGRPLAPANIGTGVPQPGVTTP